jgi:hypothetical protein
VTLSLTGKSISALAKLSMMQPAGRLHRHVSRDVIKIVSILRGRENPQICIVRSALPRLLER